jgi:hypothetical protein
VEASKATESDTANAPTGTMESAHAATDSHGAASRRVLIWDRKTEGGFPGTSVWSSFYFQRWRWAPISVYVAPSVTKIPAGLA